MAGAPFLQLTCNIVYNAVAMAMQSKTQRTLLLSFIGSISSCGLVGIWCLLLGSWGWLEERILGTTAAVGGASILGLAAAIPWEGRRWRPIGPAGMIAAASALFLIILLIWAPWWLWRPEWFVKSTLIACVAAVALPHIGLLSLARLQRGYEWVRVATVSAIALLAGLITLLIIAEFGDDLLFRIMGMLGIADACGTIAVPILHRISGLHKRESVRTTELALTLTCPRCSKTQQLAVGRSRCGGCGLRFSIDIEEEHCGKCGYSLYKLESAVCPECGTPVFAENQESP